MRTLICLLVTLLVVSPTRPVTASRSRDSSLYSQYVSTCDGICLGGQALDERFNCIHKCISPSCFQSIYATKPLEDGEVDEFRKGRFLSCMTLEKRSSSAIKNWKGENNVSDKERALRDSEWEEL